jgi:hypothetical protein
MAWIVGLKTKSIERKNRSNEIMAPAVADFFMTTSCL